MAYSFRGLVGALMLSQHELSAWWATAAKALRLGTRVLHLGRLPEG